MSMCNNKFVNIFFYSNSQTSEPIRSLKSPAVDLVEEDLEVRGRGTRSDRERGRARVYK